MSAKLNKEFVATVLIESVYTTDENACKKYGISTKSLQRYRKMLAEDAELSEFVHTKKKLFDEAWAEVIPAALRKSLEFLAHAAEQAKNDPNTFRNPALIEAHAGAAKLCADIYYTGKIIDARIAESNRPADELPARAIPKRKPQASTRCEVSFEATRYAPAVYIKRYFGWTPWSGDDAHPGQQQILDAYVTALRQQEERQKYESGKGHDESIWQPGQVIQNRIRIEAGHNTGKTKIAAGLVSHFFDSFPSIIYTFAPTWEQIKDLLWKEIKTDRENAATPLPGKVLDTCEIKYSANHFAKGRATNNSNGQGTERIHGQHHPFLMFVLDEAEGVDEFVFDAIDSMASGGISIILMLANPRTRISRFYRAKDDANVINFRISCLDHPNVREGREVIPGAVTRHYVEDMLDKHCDAVERHDPDDYTFTVPFPVTHQKVECPAGTIFKPNPVFLYRVRGIPPPNVADKTLIPVGRYEAACKRQPIEGDRTRASIGIDVARFGLDYGTLYVKWNGRAWRAAQFYKQDTNDYRAKLKEVARDLAGRDVTSLHVRVDGGGGFASGIVDPIKNDSELTRLFAQFTVVEVHFNADPKDQTSFDDAITEWTASAAESLKTLAILNPPPLLLSDLCDREFKWVQRNDKDVKRLEKKAEFRKRRKPERSPDDGDGFVLAVAGEHLFTGVDRVPVSF